MTPFTGHEKSVRAVNSVRELGALMKSKKFFKCSETEPYMGRSSVHGF